MSVEVPGDVADVRTLARRWSERARAAGEAAETLRTVRDDVDGNALGLEGGFVPQLQTLVSDLPDALRKLQLGFKGCGEALATYATTLEQAQANATSAQSARATAEWTKASAEADLNYLAPGWSSFGTGFDGTLNHLNPLAMDLGDQSAAVQAAYARQQRAKSDVEAAQGLLKEAQELREGAESTCADSIRKALEDSGLENRRWWHRAGDYLKNSFTTWDGFVKLCGSIGTVLAVVALFASGPFALVIGAALLVTTAVGMADTLKQLREGKIGWKEFAGQLGMLALERVGGRALGGAYKGLQRTKTVKAFSDRSHARFDRFADRYPVGDRARNLAHRGICTITGHPVDVATGKVFTEHTDLALPGPLPFSFDRVWFSTSTYGGPLGHGWHHTYDAALLVGTDAALYRTPDGRFVDLLPLEAGQEYFLRDERLTVARNDDGYRVTDAAGTTHRFTPSGGVDGSVMHLLQEVGNRADHRLTLTRDELGNLTEVVDSGGRSLRFDHDDAGRLLALTAPHPDQEGQRFTVARYRYDAAGNLASVTDALGHEVRYGYDGHLMVAETDRTGLTFSFEYDGTDERAHCLRTWGDGGLYDHRLAFQTGSPSVTNSLGHTSRHEHEDGVVVRTVDALGGERRTRFEHRQPVEATDALGRVTTFQYDTLGNQTSVLRPDGCSVETTYDERALPVAAVDPLGGQWFWFYDEVGLLRERRDPLDRRWTYEYTAGLLAQATDPAGGVTALAYDDQGAVVTVTTPDGARSGWLYNALGWPVVVTDPLGNVQVRHFDLVGQTVRVAEPDGNIRELAYDGEGDLVHVLDKLRDVHFTYQGVGCVATREQDGKIVTFEYDTEEQLISVVNEHGDVHSITYGSTGEVIAERGFDGILRIYQRDALGRVYSVRRPSGIVSRYRYDENDRVIVVEHGDGSEKRFAYRADGVLMRAENDATTVLFERDPLGRITREWQIERWTDIEYDALGFKTRMRTSLGLEEGIERDGVGNVISVQVGDCKARMTLDEVGQEVVRELPGGVRQQLSFDSLGRPSSLDILVNGQLIRHRDYKWTFDGRLLELEDPLIGRVHYNHDSSGRLMSADYGNAHIEYRTLDDVGNVYRTPDCTDRTYGPGGRLLRYSTDQGEFTLDYDSEGHLLTQQSSEGPRIEYRWGIDGELAAVVQDDEIRARFSYDALGRRIGMEAGDLSVAWLWCGDDLIHEESSLLLGVNSAPIETSNLISRVYLPESREPLFEIGSTDVASFVCDHMGTPLLRYDSSERSFHHQWSSLWGVEPAESGTRQSLIGWPGQQADGVTQLLYSRFRYYSPSLGVYLSQDPIGLFGGLNPYAYVPDVTVMADPLGLKSVNPGVYDVFFEWTMGGNFYLDRDSQHFREANWRLYHALSADPQARRHLEGLYPGIYKHVTPGPRGGMSPRAPKGLTWHHQGAVRGLLQLVDREDHRIRHGDYHADGVGGRYIWGGGQVSSCVRRIRR